MLGSQVGQLSWLTFPSESASFCFPGFLAELGYADPTPQPSLLCLGEQCQDLGFLVSPRLLDMCLHQRISGRPWKTHGLQLFAYCPCQALEKETATHCSVLAWRIPGTGEPGGLPSMGSHRVRHD